MNRPIPSRLPRGFSIAPLRRIQRRMWRYFGEAITLHEAWALFWKYGPTYPLRRGLSRPGLRYAVKIFWRTRRQNNPVRKIEAYRLAWEKSPRYRLPRGQQRGLLSPAKSRAKRAWWAERRERAS